MVDPSHRQQAGRAFALASAVFYATRSVLVRLGLEAGAQVPELVGLRMVFTALIFFVAVRLLPGVNRRSENWRAPGLWRNPSMVTGALCFSGAVVASFYAVERIGVALTVILIYAHPVFVALLARLFLGEPLGWVRVACLVIAYSGCILAVDPRRIGAVDGLAVGALLALVAAACYACYQLLTQSLARQAATLRIGAMTAYLSLPPALALWLLGPVPFEPTSLPPASLAVTAAMGLFSTFLPLVFLLFAIERIGAATTSLFSLSSPIVALTLAWLVFGELLAPIQWAGAGLVLSAVGALTLHGRRAAS